MTTTKRSTLVAVVLIALGGMARADASAAPKFDHTHHSALLGAVVDGADLGREPRAKLRAILGPEKSHAIGLDHPGFPRACERAQAASFLADDVLAMQRELHEAMEKSRDQMADEAGALIPPGGLVVGQRTLKGDDAVNWILNHPVKYSFAMSDRRDVERGAVAAIDKMAKGAAKSIKAAVRACERASK